MVEWDSFWTVHRVGYLEDRLFPGILITSFTHSQGISMQIKWKGQAAEGDICSVLVFINRKMSRQWSFHSVRSLASRMYWYIHYPRRKYIWGTQLQKTVMFSFDIFFSEGSPQVDVLITTGYYYYYLKIITVLIFAKSWFFKFIVPVCKYITLPSQHWLKICK